MVGTGAEAGVRDMEVLARPCQWRRPVVLFKELLNMAKAPECACVLNKYSECPLLRLGSKNSTNIFENI